LRATHLIPEQEHPDWEGPHRLSQESPEQGREPPPSRN